MDTKSIIEDLKKEFRDSLREKGIGLSSLERNISKDKKSDAYWISVSGEKLKKKVPFLRFTGFAPATHGEFSILKSYLVVIVITSEISVKDTYILINAQQARKFSTNIENEIPYFYFENKSGTSHFFKINQDGNVSKIKEFLKNLKIEDEKEERYTSIMEKEVNSISKIGLRSVNTILYGPPGTGKTYNSIKYAVDTVDTKFNQDGRKKYTNYIEKFKELKDKGQIVFTTFHQSYGYEEFIEGIKPNLSNSSAEKNSEGNKPNLSDNSEKKISYKIAEGVFKKCCEEARGESGNYVFIIDEINRGNISKIFGELITLIEDSKREGEPEAMSVILPYSKKNFSVPKNVYILGTMNTADRSISLMDTALRRRFEFVEMMPDEDLLDEVVVEEDINIHEMLKIMNQRIEVLYDREHTLGHAFFMPLNNEEKATIDKLASIFKNKIIPLLQEYFYEDYEKIMLVLGINPQNTDDSKFISVKSNDGLFKNSPEIDSNTTYQINHKAFEIPGNYINIYDSESN